MSLDFQGSRMNKTPGTLHLNEDSQTKVRWGQWIQDLQQHMAAGNIVRAANLLACSWGSEREESNAEKEMQKKMFTDPVLANDQTELWKEMKPLLLKEFQPEAERRLQEEYGWSIGRPVKQIESTPAGKISTVKPIVRGGPQGRWRH